MNQESYVDLVVREFKGLKRLADRAMSQCSERYLGFHSRDLRANGIVLVKISGNRGR